MHSAVRNPCFLLETAHRKSMQHAPAPFFSYPRFVRMHVSFLLIKKCKKKWKRRTTGKEAVASLLSSFPILRKVPFSLPPSRIRIR